jgi:hypothetical protein
MWGQPPSAVHRAQLDRFSITAANLTRHHHTRPLTFFRQTVIPISFYPVRQNARGSDYAARDFCSTGACI